MTNKGNRRSLKASIMMLIVDYRTVLILIILVIAISLSSPFFFTANNLLNVLRQISVYVVLGAGFTMVVASGNIDFSVGATVSLVGVCVALLSKVDNMPFVVVVFAGLALGAGLGFLNGVIGAILKVPLLLTTFAMSKVYEGVTYLITKMSTVTRIPKVFTFIGQGYLGPIPIPVYIMAFVTIFVGIIIYRTRLGRHALAIGGNAEAARVSGVNINFSRTFTLMLMGMCSAIAAFIITGRASSAQPTAGLGMEMDALTAVVIGGTSLRGGKGKIFGTLIGALIVGIINNGLNLIGIDSNWQVVAKGLMILIAIFLDIQTELFIKKRLIKLES